MSENGGTTDVRAYPESVDPKSTDLSTALATAYVYCRWMLFVCLVFAGATTAVACASTWKGSVGAVLGKDHRTGALFVREAPSGMAADRAGIRVDDEITAIDGAPVRGMSAQEIHEKLAGDVGTKVKLTVARTGEPAREIVVERGPLRGETLP